MQDCWAIAFAPEPLSSQGPPPVPLGWIEPPRGHFYADPFLVQRDGEPWVFFEDYCAATGLGHISATPLLRREVRPVLRRPWHLSYPCLVETCGELFLIPEQNQADSVTLYRCRAFPDDWVAETVLLDGFAGVDPTVFWWGGRWWMYVGDQRQRQRARDRTYLFHAPELTGPWIEHTVSPAIQRPDLARPAGLPWLLDEHLVRPAQNRTRTYGGGMVLYQVNRLTAEEYCETEWARWEPSPLWPYPDGLHHVSSLPGWTVWDAKRFVEEL